MAIAEADLRSVPAFRALSDPLLEAIGQISERRSYERDEAVCKQGSLPTHLFYVLNGLVALSSQAADGSSAVIEIIPPVCDFVLSSVILNQPYLQTGFCINQCVLLAIEAPGLRALIERDPVLGCALLTPLAKDYRSLVRQIRDLKLRTSAQRLGAYLLALVQDQEAKTAEVRLPFEKGLLAARLGCRQENLSRAFAFLREYGVETHGARVILHDIPRLTAYSVPDDLTDSAASERSWE